MILPFDLLLLRVCVLCVLLPFNVFTVCVSGIETNLRDSRGRTALEILREHPAPKSQQITALIQGKTLTHVHQHTPAHSLWILMNSTRETGLQEQKIESWNDSVQCED